MDDRDVRSSNNGPRRMALAACLLVAHGLLLAVGAVRHTPSIDETAHLPAGISHWVLGRYELYRVNPPLVRMVAALPALAVGYRADWSRLDPDPRSRSEFGVGEDFFSVNERQTLKLYAMGRLACIPFSLFGGWICFLWARDLYGPNAGLLALSLWAFSPTVLGNAQMITPDTAATALGAAAFYGFRGWLTRPRWRSCAWTGVVLGLALLTKTTWVILFALWPAMWLIGAIAGRQPPGRPWRREAVQLILTLTVALGVLNGLYGFDGSFQRLDRYAFISKSLAGKAAATGTGNRFRGTALGAIPVPFPREFVQGIDVQKRDLEGPARCYLLGQWKYGGWWYYYLVGLAVKVPLGAWCLLLIAAGLRFTPGRGGAAPWREEVFLLTPAAVILALASSQTGLNRHMRYIMPIVPYAMIWLGSLARAFPALSVRGKALVVLSWCWFVGSSLAYFPHSLSYFNELAGGPIGGRRILIDSNVDWGQDLYLLMQWLDRHPEARPLGLAYFGGFDPSGLGVRFELPPSGSDVPDDRTHPPGPRSGWYAVSVSMLEGTSHWLPTGRGSKVLVDEADLGYFRRFEPVATAGYSIYIYHLERDEVDRVRRQLGLPLESDADEADARSP